MEIADKKNLERDIKVYASSIIELSNCDYLPFNWLASTKEFREVLNNYQKKADSYFDLTPAINALDSFEVKLNELFHFINNSL